MAVLDAIKRNTERTSLWRDPGVLDIPFMKQKKNKVYTFFLSWPMSEIAASGTVDVSGALSFHLNDFSDYLPLTEIFDAYRIIQVRTRFVAGTQLGVANPAGNPPLHTVIDYDDDNALSALDDALEYDTWTVVPAGTSFDRTLSPRTAMQVFGGGVTTAYAQNNTDQWIDCAYPAVPFYGLKYYLQAATSANQSRWTPFVTAVIQFRNPR